VSERRPLLIGIAAALGLLLLWFFVLWSPQGSRLSDARDRERAAEAEQQELQARIARLQSLQRDEPQKRAQLESLRVAIPDEPNLAQFILDANTAANTSGINFLSISPSPPVAGTGPTPGSAPTPTTTPGAAPAGPSPAVINLQLSVSGGYFQVLDFVNRLNGLSRLVVIDTVSLATGGQSTAGATGLTVSIAARMFVRTATPVAGSPTAPGAPGATTTTSTTTRGATTTAPSTTTSTP
jgi:Tfp pilus assembly protein PilO